MQTDVQSYHPGSLTGSIEDNILDATSISLDLLISMIQKN